MSTQITTAFVQQFSANVQMLSQQKGSLLRRAVREESVTGEKAFFDQVGSAVAQKKTSRHGDTPLAETPHSRRMVTMDHWEYAKRKVQRLFRKEVGPSGPKRPAPERVKI